MIVIGNTVISDDILNKFFVCHIEKCKGACCVEGDLGAPLEKSELDILEEIFELIKPYLSDEGIIAIEEQGFYIRDFEGDFSTPTVHGRECAYALYDKNGNMKCGLEMAYDDGKTDFKKPLSCHLYPVRIKENETSSIVNVDSWHICNPACSLGEKLQVPVYQFLKEALIRKFGLEWYRQLEEFALKHTHENN